MMMETPSLLKPPWKIQLFRAALRPQRRLPTFSARPTRSRRYAPLCVLPLTIWSPFSLMGHHARGDPTMIGMPIWVGPTESRARSPRPDPRWMRQMSFLDLPPHKLVRAAGLEPATVRLKAGCCCRLSYARGDLLWGDRWGSNPGDADHNRGLCRLSYGHTREACPFAPMGTLDRRRSNLLESWQLVYHA